MKRLILASGSPRRKELLEQIGYEFEIITSDCDEKCEFTVPEEYVMELSREKCLNVAEKILPGVTDMKPGIHSNREFRKNSGDGHDFIVIGADTIVVLNGKILGKPADKDDAFHTLKALQGNTHSVYTGVTLFDASTGRCHSFYEKTDVKMYPADDETIMDYILTGEPMDKAGSYGIQGMGAVLVEGISGDYFNVVGLPIARLNRELGAFNR